MLFAHKVVLWDPLKSNLSKYEVMIVTKIGLNCQIIFCPINPPSLGSNVSSNFHRLADFAADRFDLLYFYERFESVITARYLTKSFIASQEF